MIIFSAALQQLAWKQVCISASFATGDARGQGQTGEGCTFSVCSNQIYQSLFARAISYMSDLPILIHLIPVIRPFFLCVLHPLHVTMHWWTNCTIHLRVETKHHHFFVCYLIFTWSKKSYLERRQGKHSLENILYVTMLKLSTAAFAVKNNCML